MSGAVQVGVQLYGAVVSDTIVSGAVVPAYASG